jgi:cell division protein FtsL
MNNLKLFIILLVLCLLGSNAYIFTKTLFLGDNILKIEIDSEKLKIENSDLEKKFYSLTSLKNLTELASSLGFTKQSEPIYLDNLKYASTK